MAVASGAGVADEHPGRGSVPGVQGAPRAAPLGRPRPARPGREFVTALIESRRQERAPPRVKLLVVSPRDPQPCSSTGC